MAAELGRIAVPVFALFAAGVSLRGTDPGAIAADPIVLGIVAGPVLGKVIGGTGFTVSLLIGELAYGAGTERDGAAEVAVVAGSVIAATLAALVLSRRNEVHRHLHERASRDADADGVPDIYRPSPRPDDND